VDNFGSDKKGALDRIHEMKSLATGDNIRLTKFTPTIFHLVDRWLVSRKTTKEDYHDEIYPVF
jgi:hypothetical protein